MHGIQVFVTIFRLLFGHYNKCGGYQDVQCGADEYFDVFETAEDGESGDDYEHDGDGTQDRNGSTVSDNYDNGTNIKDDHD